MVPAPIEVCQISVQTFSEQNILNILPGKKNYGLERESSRNLYENPYFLRPVRLFSFANQPKLKPGIFVYARS